MQPSPVPYHQLAPPISRLIPRQQWAALLGCSGFMAFVLAVALQGRVGVGAVAIGMAAAGGIAFFLLPIRTSIFLYFGYLLFDGMIKILSNYNQILHVGQDLVLLLLVARSCWESGGGAKIQRLPRVGFLVVLLGWILIQYVNPWGIGLWPSIAGTKVYVSMMGLFFLIYHHFQKEDIDVFLRWLLILGLFECAFSTWEFMYGQSFLLGLHPKYKIVLTSYLGTAFYRPFGTTAVPGGPSVWAMLVLPVAGYFLAQKKIKTLDRFLSFGFLASAVPTLIFCQVRTSIVFGIIGFSLNFFRPGGHILRRIFYLGLIVGVFGFSANYFFDQAMLSKYSWMARLSTAQRSTLLDRMSSLGKKDSYLKARENNAMKSTMALADVTLLGIGLSRVGAAAEVWTPRLMNEQYFGMRWAFADNLYKAIFTELGFFGFFAWLSFVGILFFDLVKGALRTSDVHSRSVIWLSSISVGLLLIAGYGNEGVLYNPVSGFFWAMMSLGMKGVADHG